jgi:3-hydroxybutyryl-CoA dehydrogenase
VNVGVIGAGTMGAGIVLTALYAGLSVRLYDISPDALDRAQAYITPFLKKKGQLDRLALLQITTALDTMADRDLIIEAALEDRAVKIDLLRQLESICPPRCIFASNTSTLSITALAGSLAHPQRVIGMHFFNPAPVMKLVEIILAVQTDEATVAAAQTLALSIGKTPIIVRDTPGFIVNRVARPYYLESLKIVTDGLASHQDVDAALEMYGFRMGPFRLMDVIGLDVSLAASQSIYEQTFHEPRFRPSVLQAQRVAAGRLGKKSGRGFYDYASGEAAPAAAPPDGHVAPPGSLAGIVGVENTPAHIAARVIAMLVNEAAFAVDEGIADMDTIDTALRLGANHPRGISDWLREIGQERVVAILDDLYAFYHQERYRVAPGLRRSSRATG